MRGSLRFFVALGLSLLAPAPASIAAVDKSPNITLVAHHPYPGARDPFSGGSELAAQGRWLYSAQLGDEGGLHIFDRSRRRPRRASFMGCGGEHADVEVVGPGLIAFAHESTTCSAGLLLVDVSDPARPRRRGSVSIDPHTITAYPGKPFIYVSGGGLGKARGDEWIVDASDPDHPEVVATFRPNPAGCHDLDFFVTKEEQLAVCVGGGEGQVWDVSDPFAPATIGHVPVLGALPHSVAISPDGRYIAIGEESAAGECATPLGSMQLFDFSIRQAPILLAHYETPYDSEPPAEFSFCSPNFVFIPRTPYLLTTWGRAGLIVLDISAPTSPKEVAHYVATGDDPTYYWGIEYRRGLIWANDRARGLDVLELDD